jgi:hypothetical protein
MAELDRDAAVIGCLSNIGQGWRSSWSEFDGRTLRDQLLDVASILNPKTSEADVARIVAETQEFYDSQTSL